jgi:adenylate cyclase class IV
MPRNIEIKARIDDIGAVTALAAALATEGPVAIPQDDTFFHCESGRLKLRAFSGTSGELIYYQRPDQTGPKESFYMLSPTSNVASLREALSLAYGQSGRVRKQRVVYLAGRTRIHLDQVEGLGSFLELEVVLAEGEAREAGMIEAHALMKELGIPENQLVEGAYLDLLAAKESPMKLP